MKTPFNLLAMILFFSHNGASATEQRHVLDGETLTLESSKTSTDDLMTWYFNYIHIAEINGSMSNICTDDQCKERFRDRLKLDQETGSLTIMNISITDTGVYKLQIISSNGSSCISRLKTFNVTVFCASATEQNQLRHVIDGETLTLESGEITRTDDLMTWYFNYIPIAEINGSVSKICTDDQCKERFRDRLKLDNQTGSLTIMNISITDTGVYKLQIISSNGSSCITRLKTFNVTVFCASATEQNQLRHMIDGETLTLESGETTNTDHLMTWYFNYIPIAEINGSVSKICTDEKERFRDRLKLDLRTGSLTITNIRTTDSGLYKLQIISRNGRFCRLRRFNVAVFFPAVGICVIAVLLLMVATVSAGVVYCRQKKYKPEIKKLRMMLISRRRIRKTLLRGLGMTLNQTHDEAAYKIICVSGVGSDVVPVSLKEGDSVIFDTGVKTKQQEDIKWYFYDTRIAQISGDLIHACTDVQCKDSDERFRNRLKLENQTGSLTVMNITNTDSGLYELKIISSTSSSEKIFNVTVNGVSASEMKTKSVKGGECVTLESEKTRNLNDGMTWYFNETLIAEITGDQSQICADDECKERFRDRLKLDNQTGSLTIMNIKTTDSGLYKLQIFSSSSFSVIRVKTLSVTGIVVPDPGLSSAAVGGIVVLAVVLLVAAAAVVVGVFYCRRKRHTPVPQNDEGL
ncbi:uncharacterized protein LOC122328101 [Puntigrus tetrazona]|uniref:uncharacterized protein LOC122328101 n=1 Tax=Puntigrus tetrazona TaxID=1606681 RepID=UPI001C896A24|nr:uncharacterized protein LOC122328101 [Puntigrus tetrazona]